MAGGPEEVTQIITHKRRAFQYFSKHSTDFGINPFFSLPKTPNTYTITTTQCRNAIKKFANRTAARRFPHDICHAHSVLSASNIQKKKKTTDEPKKKARHTISIYRACHVLNSVLSGCRMPSHPSSHRVGICVCVHARPENTHTNTQRVQL